MQTKNQGLSSAVPSWVGGNREAWERLPVAVQAAAREAVPAAPTASLATRLMMARNGASFEAFLRKFCPAKLKQWARTAAGQIMPAYPAIDGRTWCMISPTAPTLGMVRDAYGAESAARLVALNLYEFANSFGFAAERKPNADQLSEAGAAWVANYPGGKVTELWVFFDEVKSGKSGEQIAYGSVELSKLGAAYSRFFARRQDLQSRYLAARKSQEARMSQLAAGDSVPTEEQRARMLELLNNRKAFEKLPPAYQESVRKFCRRWNLTA